MIKEVRYHGKRYSFRATSGVVRDDYYKNALLPHLPGIVSRLSGGAKALSVLEMATGNGLLAVVLAGGHSDVGSIVAYDINQKAVELAAANANLNGVAEKISFRCGSLFEPVAPGELFDLIIGVLPAIPIATEDLAELPVEVRGHHWPTSTGGVSGRDLVESMIGNVGQHLKLGGMVLTAHADFLDHQKTLRFMEKHGLGASCLLVGTKKLRETVLTNLRKEAIEALGYRFERDRDGDLYFKLMLLLGVAPG